MRGPVYHCNKSNTKARAVPDMGGSPASLETIQKNMVLKTVDTMREQNQKHQNYEIQTSHVDPASGIAYTLKIARSSQVDNDSFSAPKQSHLPSRQSHNQALSKCTTKLILASMSCSGSEADFKNLVRYCGVLSQVPPTLVLYDG